MSKEVFKWKRFGSLCWTEIKREGWWPLIMMALFLIVLFLEYQMKGSLESKGRMSAYAGIFLLLSLFLLVLLFSSFFMSPLKSRSLRAGYLLLPVSTAERYFSRLIVVLYPSLFCVLVSLPFLADNSSLLLGSPFMYSMVYGQLLFTASLGVLCSLFWPKYGFLVIILVGILIRLLESIVHFVLRLGIGYKPPTSEALAYYLNPEYAPWIFSTAFLPWGIGALTLFNFVISYFRLREIDEKLSW